MKWILIVLVMIGAGLGGAYWWAGKDEVALTDTERAKAPGQFLDTPDGKLHYLLRGPENGPPIVLVHGFSTPHFIYEQNASSLAANGFRVVQFDHFGRGWSDRPKAAYDVDFYDRELLSLLDGLNLTEPVGLVGLSMGGVISAEFAARHPQRVERLFLLVPAGLATSGSDDFRATLTRMPIIGDWIWRVWGKQVLLGDPQYSEDTLPEMNRLQGDVAEQMNYKGYFPALLSTYRNLPMTDRDDTFVQVAETAIPVTAVFGEDDPTIPVAAADRLRALMPAADIRVLAQADHGLNYKDFEIINPWLIEFFSPMLPSPETATLTEANATSE